MNKNLITNISEEEYRQLPHISYSKISKFISNGPKSLLDSEKFTTKNHMSIGNVFDTLLTEPNKISEKYFIGEKKLTDKQISIIKDYITLDVDDDTVLIELLNKYEFQSSYTDKTRLKNFYSSDDVNTFIISLKTNNNLRIRGNIFK